MPNKLLTTLTALSALSLSVSAALPAAASNAFGVQEAQEAQESKKSEPTLKVGDKAPPLGDGKWIKGEPVEEFESGKVYVIECWATWCGPCIAAIPHITELQKKYEDKGLVIIGQNMWEDDEEAVEPFVEKMGDKMDYRVVMDEPSGQEGHMAKTWMKAAGRNGIPCSFIVDQEGKIAWIGHPMQMGPVIEKVLAGDFDPEAEADKEKELAALGQKLNAAARAGDTDAAVKAADEIAEARPEQAGRMMMIKFQLLAEAERWDEAYEAGDEAAEELEDPMALNELAWSIVDPESEFEKKDLDVAMKAAAKAVELSKSEDGAILDTLARVYWLKGDKEKAIELQEKAVEITDDPQMKRQIEETLEEYKRDGGRA